MKIRAEELEFASMYYFFEKLGTKGRTAKRSAAGACEHDSKERGQPGKYLEHLRRQVTEAHSCSRNARNEQVTPQPLGTRQITPMVVQSCFPAIGAD